ncbi:hypothetical protein [Terrabacter sp. Root181]|uniref:hypothetical protein n=1 Tax=Terrabacter sp. Root181 TaxID=1736484 RepID=UPI000A4319B0|nr:hypothetical protein [Terrabacter sp. Root181]
MPQNHDFNAVFAPITEREDIPVTRDAAVVFRDALAECQEEKGGVQEMFGVTTLGIGKLLTSMANLEVRIAKLERDAE